MPRKLNDEDYEYLQEKGFTDEQLEHIPKKPKGAWNQPEQCSIPDCGVWVWSSQQRTRHAAKHEASDATGE